MAANEPDNKNPGKSNLENNTSRKTVQSPRMSSSSLQAEVSARVKAQYEAYPYPHYALGLPLRVQEGYASHAGFAARLLSQYRAQNLSAHHLPHHLPNQTALNLASHPRILMAGCGDTFPYVLAHWEPRHHRLIAVDLSHANLRRARMRCMLGPLLQPLALSTGPWRHCEWRQGNLEDDDFAWPTKPEETFAHIDCYGVLHHLADPSRVLRRFGAALSPGGTARLMVYNRASRTWLWHLQKALKLLGLSARNPEDIVTAKNLMNRLSETSPALAARLGPMRGQALANEARFVDTFMHAREARLDWADWLNAFSAAGLTVIGLFDRYGELDDLPNPLEVMPDLAAMQARLADRRFENDFEIYVAKIDMPDEHKPDTAVTQTLAQGHNRARTQPRFLPQKLLLAPPASWFSYVETRDLPALTRHRLWRHFLAQPSPSHDFDAFAARLPEGALPRLARIGAVFRSDLMSEELQSRCLAPLHASMEPPETIPGADLRQNQALTASLLSILRLKQKQSSTFEAVIRRLTAAQ